MNFASKKYAVLYAEYTFGAAECDFSGAHFAFVGAAPSWVTRGASLRVGSMFSEKRALRALSDAGLERSTD